MSGDNMYMQVREFDAEGFFVKSGFTRGGAYSSPKGVLPLLRDQGYKAIELHREDGTSLEFTLPDDVQS